MALIRKKSSHHEVDLKDGKPNLRRMSNESDEYLVSLMEAGEVTEDMISDLPQNHPMRIRLSALQKEVKKELSGQKGLQEFRGNILGALRWSSLFDWGVSKNEAQRQASGLSDRAKDAQVIMNARSVGENILKLIQGGQAPQVQAPARGQAQAQGQGVGIGGGGGQAGGRPDLATLIAAAKKQLADNAAKQQAAGGAAKAAPSLASVPVDPKTQAEQLKAQQAAKEAEQNKQQQV